MIEILLTLVAANSVFIFIIFKQQKKIMDKEAELLAIIQELKDANTAIAAKIQAFIDAGAGGITDQSLADLQAVADQLKGEGA